jgi:hypothetical protein
LQQAVLGFIVAVVIAAGSSRVHSCIDRCSRAVLWFKVIVIVIVIAIITAVL